MQDYKVNRVTETFAVVSDLKGRPLPCLVIRRHVCRRNNTNSIFNTTTVTFEFFRGRTKLFRTVRHNVSRDQTTYLLDVRPRESNNPDGIISRCSTHQTWCLKKKSVKTVYRQVSDSQSFQPKKIPERNRISSDNIIS